MSPLDGTVAIITGASRGIGPGIASHLVARGAEVCLTARNHAALDQAVNELGGPAHAMAVAGNSGDPDHQAEVLKQVSAAFGRIDILVNNTGINPVRGPLIELDPIAARKIVELNCLTGLAWTRRAVHGGMAVHGGAIINVGSTAGLKPASGIKSYGASKAMLSHLTMRLALELAPAVRVNAVAPALVRTRFAAVLYEGREDQVAARYPLQRLGTPDDIGSLVAFLASPGAGWITGQTIVIDGGLTLTGGL